MSYLTWDQCLTWDGQILAALDIRNWDTLLHFREQPCPTITLPPSKWGNVRAMVLSAPHEFVEKISGFIDIVPLEEFIDFYRRAVSHGLLGKNFRFYVMVVFDEHVVGLTVTSTQATIFRQDRDKPLAIGRDSTAAMLLMQKGVDALHAGAVYQAISSGMSPIVESLGIAYEEVDVGIAWTPVSSPNACGGLHEHFAPLTFDLKGLPTCAPASANIGPLTT